MWLREKRVAGRNVTRSCTHRVNLQGLASRRTNGNPAAIGGSQGTRPRGNPASRAQTEARGRRRSNSLCFYCPRRFGSVGWIYACVEKRKGGAWGLSASVLFEDRTSQNGTGDA